MSAPAKHREIAPTDLRVFFTRDFGQGSLRLDIPTAEECQDWLLIWRATWGEGQLQLDALREVAARGLTLSERPHVHAAMVQQLTAKAMAEGGW